MSDRGYVNLVRHLTRTTVTSALTLDTLQASIAHYLARPPVPVPGTPTSLVAATLASPIFRKLTYAKLAALALAFRHAFHLRVGFLDEKSTARPGRLSAAQISKLARWTEHIRAGFTGSHAIVRLASASGLLLGMEDWESDLQFKKKQGRVAAEVEEEVVIALAEILDEYAKEGSGWEKDFKRTFGTGDEEEPLALAILLASQCAQCIAQERLRALPLSTVIDVLMTTIDRSFYSGAFLTGAFLSIVANAEGKLHIAPTSSLAQTIRSVTDSPYIASMSFLARFAARSLTVLVESRRTVGWDVISRTLTRLEYVTSAVASDWEKCSLACVTEDGDLADNETRQVATATWSVLKTLLFTTLMISQSILSAVAFVPSSRESGSGSQPGSSTYSSPHMIALKVLSVLSHLSFVMPQFGGVASTAEGGLPELKRAFYMALDVLSSDQEASERFVEELTRGCGASEKGKGVDNLPRPLLNARKAFALACVEQLVPILSEETIQTRVYPLCYPHLWDPSYRETYESAHSTMLAVFAAYAKSHPSSASRQASQNDPSFAERLVPMYARCLVENASDGLLSTTQLCMAYAALVRGASAFRGGAREAQPDPDRDGTVHGDAMAWFCIETLLEAIHAAHRSPPSEHLHRLHLALVATVPSVSLALLPRLLDEVKETVLAYGDPSSVSDAGSPERADSARAGEMREELVQALFKAILHDVGDAEKEYVMGWWDEHAGSLAGQPRRHSTVHADAEGVTAGPEPALARL
ncbi:hypothetical protein PYCCODRAFT_1430626 [Trametes coccinea BRFM310]|uniref:Peroxisomal membrane protein n=1 Tax=Trametes coccinea (strain BRFM310) TaxID=1353009 RepID=A0A1Y2J4L5_TRAC3|nr:hypothetical protein PYCCODRAFT_1430626 [Trametes coccinea BRFM310]